MSVEWHWQNDDGSWVPFAPVDSAMIETHRSTRKMRYTTTELSFNAHYLTPYDFDLIASTQTNMSSGKVRHLRRIDAADESDDSGLVRVLSAVPKPSAAAPSVTPVDSAASGSTAAAPVLAAPEAPLKAHKTEVTGAAVAAGTPAVSTAASVAAGWAAASVTAAPSAVAAVAAPLETDAEKASKAIASTLALPPHIAACQAALGSQSLRKQKYDLGPVAKDHHGKHCFDRMLSREKQLSGEWSVFYHSYSFAALLYEVQAGVASVLFRFQSEYATLPRLLKKPFNSIPDAATLQERFKKMPQQDHSTEFREVGICATTSLLAEDSEAPPKRCFLQGYSCTDLSFVGVLENLLVSCGVPDAKKKELAQQIILLGSSHGLDVSQFKGPKCKSGRAGHLLQIFVKRSLVNRYAYASMPYGVPDKARPDLEEALQSAGPISGQVRIVPNPSVFMRANAARMYVYSADPTFHAGRQSFQRELVKMLTPIVGAPEVRVVAAQGIYDGVLPSWFISTDFEEQQKKKAAATS